jgi:hypothetical protein
MHGVRKPLVERILLFAVCALTALTGGARADSTFDQDVDSIREQCEQSRDRGTGVFNCDCFVIAIKDAHSSAPKLSASSLPQIIDQEKCLDAGFIAAMRKERCENRRDRRLDCNCLAKYVVDGLRSAALAGQTGLEGRSLMLEFEATGKCSGLR